MKKFLLIIATVLLFASCTEQNRAKKFGGEVTIEAPVGYKVTSATWKGDNIFNFLEPMEDGYLPKEKKFIESSSYGLFETKVTFIESR